MIKSHVVDLLPTRKYSFYNLFICDSTSNFRVYCNELESNANGCWENPLSNFDTLSPIYRHAEEDFHSSCCAVY